MRRTLHRWAFAVALAALSLAAAAPASAQSFTGEQEEAIRRLVREYLLQHPEVILEAIEALEARQKATQEQRSVAAIRENWTALLDDPQTPVGGNPKGDVTIVEFFDYRCTYCKRVSPVLKQLLAEDGKVRFVYKEWPILGPVSQLAARAAYASIKQGKYQAFHGALMAAQDLDEAGIYQIAQSVGLDVSRLKSDMERLKDETDQHIARNYKLAAALEITGTPGFVIGDQVVRGAAGLEELRQILADVRARGANKKHKS